MQSFDVEALAVTLKSHTEAIPTSLGKFRLSKIQKAQNQMMLRSYGTLWNSTLFLGLWFEIECFGCGSHRKNLHSEMSHPWRERIRMRVGPIVNHLNQSALLNYSNLQFNFSF